MLVKITQDLSKAGTEKEMSTRFLSFYFDTMEVFSWLHPV